MAVSNTLTFSVLTAKMTEMMSQMMEKLKSDLVTELKQDTNQNNTETSKGIHQRQEEHKVNFHIF